jgi:UDP-N-acetylglucosamine 2-epimerase (non-hydrolysing)
LPSGCPRHVLVVFGTRPEAIKLAPVVAALRASTSFRATVAVTAQHRNLLDQVLRMFSITPDFDLNIIREGQTLTDVTIRGLSGLQPILERQQPDLVLVQGDTTTTFAGALAAFYCKIPVVHLEAGLRTHDRLSPYPEEINRRVTTQLASLHLAPTQRNKSNLLAENIREDSVFVTGNTVIDSLLWAVNLNAVFTQRTLRELDRDPRRVLLVTLHRRESWGRPMAAIAGALTQVASREPDLLIVVPMHPNPVVRDALIPKLGRLPNILLVDPLPYIQFARLMNRSHLILTDSGGIQEEGPSLGKPVLVARTTTERPEAVAAGAVKVVGLDCEVIIKEVRRLLLDSEAYGSMARAINPYGDGQAVRRTVACIAHFLGAGPLPDEFMTDALV